MSRDVARNGTRFLFLIRALANFLGDIFLNREIYEGVTSEQCI